MGMRVAVLLFFSVISLPLMAQDCALCGKWHSNEAKTLADIEARVPSYPASLRKMFGKLNLEYSAKAVRVHMDGDPKPDETSWVPYTLEKRPAGQAQLLRMAGPDGKWQETAIEFHQGCYRIFIPTRQGPGFYDYFCRVAK